MYCLELYNNAAALLSRQGQYTAAFQLVQIAMQNEPSNLRLISNSKYLAEKIEAMAK